MSTYMEIVEADDANPNTIKEPAKVWHNWYCALSPIRCADGTEFEEGDLGMDDRPHPSKDVAQQVANDETLANVLEFGADWFEYLGAFPEGERP